MNMKSGLPPPPLTQRESGLLSKEENELIFHLLGPKCQTLCTTVVQLFLAYAPEHNKWIKKDTGVLCFVKDNAKKAYFFRLYCPTRRRLVWEHEMYQEVDYLAPRQFLHTFEGEDCIVGFNFASPEEAMWVYDVVSKKLDDRRQKWERKCRNMYHREQLNHKQERESSMVNGTSSPFPHSKSLPKGNQEQPRKRKEKDGKRKLTKADIGKPQDFKHISHVGFDPNKGFELETNSEELKEFFYKAGVSDNHLQDKATREFIYDFIQKNGGIDAVTKDVRPPPVPARSAAASRQAPPPPPAPPSRTGPAPLPPTHTPPPPPPPPPLRTLPQRPTQETQSQTSWTPPPPPPPMTSPIIVPPPPPPPPPMMSLPADDTPPSSYTSTSSSASAPPPPPLTVDPRSALMDAIKSGRKLKHVEVDTDNKSVKSADSRGELLDQIRQGIELKPVQVESRSSNNSSAPEDGLAGALARALAERSRAIHSESSDSDDDEEEDDEWED